MSQQDLGAEALRAEAISKAYGPSWVLRDVDMTVHARSVHGLIGANGAGKSTLIKIFSGVETPTGGGKLFLWGRRPHRNEARERLGLGVVHQQLPLANGLTIMDNLASGMYWTARQTRVIRWRRERSECRALLEEYGLKLDPSSMIDELTQGERTQLAILRVIRSMRQYGNRRWAVLLDEPTAALSGDDSAKVLQWIRDLAGAGGAVIFVSHRLAEIQTICDHVTVLRNGRVTWTGSTKTIDTASLTDLMMGQIGQLAASPSDSPRTGRGSPDGRREPAVGGSTPPANRAVGTRNGTSEVLRCEMLTGKVTRGVSVSFHRSKVLGITGLIGTGYDELMHLIIGDRPVYSGEVWLNGESVRLTPRTALSLGVVAVPGKGAEFGIWTEGTVRENLTISSLHRYTTFGLISRRLEREAAEELIASYAIAAPGLGAPASALSGGNQQKVLLARALSCGGQAVLLEEPVQGVDVRARAEIQATIRTTAERGTAVGVFSADEDFLAACCDEVVVMSQGAVHSVLGREEIDGRPSRITEACQEAIRQG